MRYTCIYLDGEDTVPPHRLLHRHPGPPSETKGARASGVRGGGFNDPLDSVSYQLVSCSLPQRVCQVLTSAPGLIPGHRGHAYRHSLVCGAIYRLSAESLFLVTQAEGAEAATD